MIGVRELGRLAETLAGIPVWGCLPGSPAARAGVRYGDIVMSVNGVRTTSLDAYASALNDATSTLTIVVFREGAEVTLKLRLARRKRSPADVEAAARQVVEGRLVPVSRSKKSRSDKS